MDHTAKNLCRLMEALAAETKRSVSTVARLTSGSGDTYSRLKSGKRITTERAGRIFRTAAHMWPLGADWPADIPRPVARDDAQDAA